MTPGATPGAKADDARASGAAGRIVRVTARGKPPAAVARDVAAAARGGRRVLVDAGPVADGIAERPGGGQDAVAAWADALAREHRLDWRRVGRDVLFGRPAPG